MSPYESLMHAGRALSSSRCALALLDLTLNCGQWSNQEITARPSLQLIMLEQISPESLHWTGQVGAAIFYCSPTREILFESVYFINPIIPRMSNLILQWKRKQGMVLVAAGSLSDDFKNACPKQLFQNICPSRFSHYSTSNPYTNYIW